MARKIFDISKAERNELLDLYNETKDIKIRNKLILLYIGTAEAIAKDFSLKYDLDYNEVLSFAYEGIIRAIENYNPNNKSCFSVSIYTCIYRTVERNIIKLDMGKFFPESYYKIIKSVIKEVEIENNITLYEESSLGSIVAERVSKQLNLSDKSKDILKNYIFAYYSAISLSDKNYDFIVNNNYTESNQQFIRESLLSAIKILSPLQQKVIKLKFNLVSEGELEEIKNALSNITRQRISHIKLSALKRLSRTGDIIFLKRIINDFSIDCDRECYSLKKINLKY